MVSTSGMPLSKLWMLLLTLLCALLVLPLLVLEPELRRRDAEEQSQRLLRAQVAAEQLLANQAHQLVAAATQMAGDAVLQTTLHEMGRGQAELPLLHDAAQSQLRRLSQPLDQALRGQGGLGLLLCADGRGRVLARLLHDEAVYRDPIDGFPIVEAALRGYRLDDLWLLDGVLYRVAASPVVAPSHDRYVGAVLIGQALGSDIVRMIHQMTGVQAVILAGGRVVATSLSGEVPDAHMLLAAHSDKNPPSAIVPAGTEPTLGASAPVIRRLVAGQDRLLAFVEMPGAAAQQGALLVLLSEVTTAKTLSGLLRDGMQHARDWRIQGLVGLLGGVAVLFAMGLGIMRAESAPQKVPRGQSSAAHSSGAAAARASAIPPPISARAFSVGGPVTSVAAGHVAETVAPAPGLWAPSSDFASDADGYEEQPPTPPAGHILPPPNSNFEPTLIVGGVPDADGVITDPDASFYQVFQEYVLTRERCRESVEGISYEQFRQRLQESRAEIIKQHGCRTVNFQVYVKEGRAALRATPIWR